VRHDGEDGDWEDANAPGETTPQKPAWRVRSALGCPDMPPRYPDTSNAQTRSLTGMAAPELVCLLIPSPFDRPDVRFTTPDITQRL
jgi:hypothetical protein